MKFKIFVDGQFGTTGLKIHEMLSGRDEFEVLKIEEKDKKRPEIKQEFINEADLVFISCTNPKQIKYTPNRCAVFFELLFENKTIQIELGI